MPAYKNKESGSWYVVTQYTDWTGERKQKCKRGFSTRREALEWEQKFQQQSAGDLDMSFEAFVEIYTSDLKARLKESTWQTKEHIIKTKIIPYFGKRKINDITTKDVIAWQNELLAFRDDKHKPYSQTYLKTLHNQLSAIFNHAVRYYDLHSNPAAKAGNMGNEERKEMLFWTKEEYQKFSEEIMDKPISYYAFQMLYWTGIREGELLALTPADFDFERGTVKISKTYQRIKGRDVITSPKTKKSNRTIQMPDFLCTEMQEFFGMQYGLKKKDRIFTMQVLLSGKKRLPNFSGKWHRKDKNMTENEKKIFLEWELFLRNLTDFVQIAKINGIKFEVRTNEQSGHHRPHLHVSTSSASISVAIYDGEILACTGKISPAQKKMAKEWMEKNRGLVESKWNDFSNGIKISVA